MAIAGLTEEQQESSPRSASSSTAKSFRSVSLEHADEFPGALVEQMRTMGLFGVTIPEEYGGLGLRSTPTR